MRQLYPEIDCYRNHVLPVGDGHQVYVEECGNLDGIPVVFLHGGPGSGCNENHRRYFHPDRYRIVLFDQRGCNRSRPQGETSHNTTQDLINDLELIRQHLAINKWLVFGGSWGATLGLLYTEAFPDQVLGMILRGCFLARQQDLDWFSRDGASRIFPDHWQEFIATIPVAERSDLIAAVHSRVFGNDEDEKLKAARAWSRWSSRVVTYTLPDGDSSVEEDIPRILHEVAVEMHYAMHRYFIEENRILDEIDSLPDVPITIIHGRRDMTCTLQASWALHQAIPRSELHIIPDAGHLAGEPAMIDALIDATDNMHHRLTS
ncbi:MAG: prolyl aminopeptidase [Gammaproteobacteria bacterium RBG_16_51_14]|nr:MAG: prolyl aminopeptidase [Gammaproteobacteria bacterium RBG_16_51_14]